MELIELNNNLRNTLILKKTLEEIADSDTANLQLMEVCGSHTTAISQSGLRKALAGKIRFVSGPGCPVCVTPAGGIDALVETAHIKDAELWTFGDMLRVPGTKGSLEDARLSGAKVTLMYSPEEALSYARKNKDKKIVMAGVGFETTAPVFAAVLAQAQEEQIENLFIIPLFKLIPPAIRAVLKSEEVNMDGFILPGHVSAIIGLTPYEFIAEEFKLWGIVCGFEALDILEGIKTLISQTKGAKTKILNQYKRVVTTEGNPTAIRLMSEVFSVTDTQWRGLGKIKGSGLILAEKFKRFDALKEFNVSIREKPEPPGCVCGEILRGIKMPPECSLFGKLCRPQNPVGPCMVSSEGACAAYYKYNE